MLSMYDALSHPRSASQPSSIFALYTWTWKVRFLGIDQASTCQKENPIIYMGTDTRTGSDDTHKCQRWAQVPNCYEQSVHSNFNFEVKADLNGQ